MKEEEEGKEEEEEAEEVQMKQRQLQRQQRWQQRQQDQQQRQQQQGQPEGYYVSVGYPSQPHNYSSPESFFSLCPFFSSPACSLTIRNVLLSSISKRGERRG
jgi:hypothetical protein